MNLGNFLDAVFFTVIRIQTFNPKFGTTSIGTGFLYQAELSSTVHSHAVFLVSNRHVFEDTTCQLTLTFHKRGANETIPSLIETLPVTQTDFSRFYTEHPDADTDLACLNISPIINANPLIFNRLLEPNLLTESTNPELYPGKDVFFVGYPDNRFDIVHNLPILRRGYIASVPTIDFNGKPQFIVDAQVFPGSSGSPVFVNYGNAFRLIGVITATMIKSERLEPLPHLKVISLQDFGVKQTIGLGIVIKVEAMNVLIKFAVESTIKLIGT